MTSLPPPSAAALTVQPHLAPIIHTFTSPDLQPILRRSHFDSMSHMLSAFEASVERVQVRSTTYEPRQLPRFPVKFVERPLPNWFETKIGGTASSSGRPRSSTVTSSASAGSHQQTPQVAGHSTPQHPNSQVMAHTAQQLAPSTPQTPFSWPSQAERDELFLDSLSSTVGANLKGWISQTGREELEVHGARPKPRLPDLGEEAQPVIEDDEGWQGRSIESLTPWYAAMRDQVLKRREMVEWDTFAWPVGCLLALSTSHPDPMNALASLWDLTSKDNLFAPASYPPQSGAEEDGRHDWAQPDILRYVVLIHDFGAGGSRDAWEDAQTLHETIRKTYGLHTALLSVFSASTSAAHPQPPARGVDALWRSSAGQSLQATLTRPVMDLGITNEDETDGFSASQSVDQSEASKAYGAELSDDDVRALKIFVREMVVQSIIPWMERSIVVGAEQFAASKRSIGGRLFSAGRKYFGSATSSRSGSPVSASGAQLGFNSTRGFYPFTAQESQLRRVADLAFMLTDYKFAASVYESVSKDFRNDKAWRYFSSASRMVGLAQMLGLPSESRLTFNPDQWLELAAQSPLSNAAGVDLDGIQAQMLYYEVYRALDDWRYAPSGLLRTAGDADELCSALLLEQAALADLHLPRPLRRKYAFHMAMAAARYEKCGFKLLSRRCLAQASSVFKFNSNLENDVRHPRQPAAWTGIRGHLYHGLGRQAYSVGRSIEAAEQFLQLLVGQAAVESEDLYESDWLDDFALAWTQLGPQADEMAAQRKVTLPITLFSAEQAKIRTTREDCSVDQSDEAWTRLADEMSAQWPFLARPANLNAPSEGNKVVLHDDFFVELVVTNPLHSNLRITDVGLVANVGRDVVDFTTPEDLELGPKQSATIYVPAKANELQSFEIEAVSYRFNGMLLCQETLVRRSKPQYVAGKSEPVVRPIKLSVAVHPPSAALAITLNELPAVLRAGEGVSASITVTNVGQVSLSHLLAMCDSPSLVLFNQPIDVPADTADNNASISNSLGGKTLCELLPTRQLEPEQSEKVTVLVRGDSMGYHRIRFVFAFKDGASGKIMTARASTSIEILPSLEIRPLIKSSVTPESTFTVSLNVTNIDLPQNVHITGVSAISPLWKLDSLEESEALMKGLPIIPKQTAMLHFSVVQVQGAASRFAPVMDFVARQMGSLLDGKDVAHDDPPKVAMQCSSVPSMSSPSLTFQASAARLLQSTVATHRELRTASLAAQFPTIPTSLHRWLFPLFSPFALDLLVFWQIPSTQQQGYHHLTGIPLGAASNELRSVLATAETKAGGLYAESQRERTLLLSGLAKSEFGRDDNPAKIWTEVNDVLSHDFEQGPCIVPVAFKIRNLSPNKAFTFTLCLSDLTAKLPLDVAFAGSILHRGEVQPCTTETVTTQLWVSREGSYNIGGWKLTAQRSPDLTWELIGPRFEVRVADSSLACLPGYNLVPVYA
ncbi:hypothetical protein OIV83_000855 [Microbotryomycetes sp. JL201]|nr:hypothetical protein OIV83_000855 [Microbotryomycetes sp. JL201]